MTTVLYDIDRDVTYEIYDEIGMIVEMELLQHNYYQCPDGYFPMDTECIDYWLRFTGNLRKLYPVMKRASREQIDELIAIEEPYLDDPMVAQQVEMAYFGID